jgi:hypothetical protein
MKMGTNSGPGMTGEETHSHHFTSISNITFPESQRIRHRKIFI